MRIEIMHEAVAALGFGALFLLGAACGPSQDPGTEEPSAKETEALNGAVCLGGQAGAYCGNDMMQGASASTLYQCPGPGKAPISAQACANGCNVAPPGKPDACQVGPVCMGGQPGAYCGGDSMQGADASTLYQCPGAGKAPTSAQPCANGCTIAPPGSPDVCKVAPGGGPPGSYRLPWPAGTTMWLAQDCNDSCCADHVGSDKYAWDFGNGTGFPIHAARAGTVTHVKMNSTSGCGSVACVNEANFLVIDHGDGTESTYLHLQAGTLDPAVTCGAHVAQGQHLATAGTTGWSSGTHLHYQVSAVHAAAPTCECGAGGQGCSASYVPWGDFWTSGAYPTLPVAFQEWPAASSCANRRITMPASQN